MIFLGKVIAFSCLLDKPLKAVFISALYPLEVS